MIKANCRDRFTAEDFDFVVKTLSNTRNDAVSLTELLTDAETRDTILEHQRLVDAILNTDAQLRISPQLYFYVLTRHVLKSSGFGDRPVADYLASLLEHFSRTARMKSPTDSAGAPVQYLSDMLIALQTASSAQSFLLRAHVGNYALFITGIFHESVEKRSRRGAPDVSFYEELGAANFKTAAAHPLAKSADLSPVFESLAGNFHEARLALNRMSDSLLSFEEPVTLIAQP